VLDVVPQSAGQSAAAAFRETAEVAQAADDLGYRRFWLAEHHGVRGVGSASPAVLPQYWLLGPTGSGWAPVVCS